jgi:hypothetical protein
MQGFILKKNDFFSCIFFKGGKQGLSLCLGTKPFVVFVFGTLGTKPFGCIAFYRLFQA